MVVASWPDPDAVPGTSVVRTIREFTGDGTGWIAIVGGAEGAMIPAQLRHDGCRLAVPLLIPLLEQVRQFNWLDVYLLSPCLSAVTIEYARLKYPQLLPKVDLLVRAVDSSYVYVFSMSHSVNEIRRIGLPWESVTLADPESFEYPD